MPMDKSFNNNTSRSVISDELTNSDDLKTDQTENNNHDLNTKSESSITVISLLILSSILLISYLSIYWAMPVYVINHFQTQEVLSPM